MIRAALIALALVLLTACGNEEPGVESNVPSIRTTEVQMRGYTYDCIVYDRESGHAGMGGIWCERRIG